MNEAEFRDLVRVIVAKGQYPHHQVLRTAMSSSANYRSGLSDRETAWRIEEVERAGYDWPASRNARRLIPRSKS